MFHSGREGKTAEFLLFLPRGPHDPARRAAWLEDLLRLAWEHGLQGTNARAWEDVTTWEQALATRGDASTGTGASYHHLEDTSLRERITAMSAARTSRIVLHGAEVELYLQVDFAIDASASPEEAALLADPLQRYRVNPYVDRLRLTCTMGSQPHVTEGLEVKGTQEQRPIYPATYLGAYEEYWRWVTVFCELTTPLVGLGYTDTMLTQQGLDAGVDLYYRTGGQEALEGRLPDLDSFFISPPARYLRPNAAALDATGDTPLYRCWRLASGGMLLRPHDPFFTPEAECAFAALERASRAAQRIYTLTVGSSGPVSNDEIRRAGLSLEHPKRAEASVLLAVAQAQAERARSLFLSAGETRQADLSLALIGEVEWFADLAQIEGIHDTDSVSDSS